MNFSSIIPPSSISLFVKNVWVFENDSEKQHTSLPFFADGYPGLMFQKTENGLCVNPHNKKMPEIFLYGQTIKPITLEIEGPYQIIIFQFYPFVLRAFWEIIPESINDSCYYLDNTLEVNIAEFTNQLLATNSLDQRIENIIHLLFQYFIQKKNKLDLSVRKAIQYIIDSKGQISIKEIATRLEINIRTLERRFLKETGISAKQFANISQFQATLHQLTTKDYVKLTDIVYENGFSDQSHFIRVFKAFTGKTPKKFVMK